MKDHHLFLLRAAEARSEAEASLLENVKERCLRSEAAWTEMAARAERTEQRRLEREAEKAARHADCGEFTFVKIPTEPLAVPVRLGDRKVPRTDGGS